MPTREDLKRSVAEEIDRRGEELVRVAKTILEHPEPGFRETKTAAVVDRVMGEMGVQRRTGIAITGVKGQLDGGAGPGPTVAVLGELDSLLVPGHPHADPSTGAAHACGHHAQIAMMLGVGMGLQAAGVLDALSGGSRSSPCPLRSTSRLSTATSCGSRGSWGSSRARRSSCASVSSTTLTLR